MTPLKHLLHWAALLGVAFTTQIHAQSSAFTYQGYLTQNGAPANSTYDLLFKVYNAATFGTQQGPDIAVDDLAVTNGLFTVTLDFSASVFDGSDRWLNIGVRPGASTDFYESLDPRQPLTATPYALQAANATSATAVAGTVAAGQLTGTLSSNNIGAGTITTVMLANGAVGSEQLAPGTVIPAQTIAGSLQTAVANASYVATSDSLTRLGLPTSANVGDTVQISGAGAGGWVADLYQRDQWTPRATNRLWYSVASSADGTKLVAVDSSPGQIYTSTDSGLSWTPRESNRFWRSVASSADGTKLVAAVNFGGQIYTSTNSGASWTARESNRTWTAVASSADGSKLVAVAAPGQIHTSTNSGVSWTARESSRFWNSVASSADGTKLVAVEFNGEIYTSTNSGVTWTARASSRSWQSVASSADGTKLVAVEYGGQIYTSTDSGVSWTPRESNRSWQSVASSADGTKLVVVVYEGWIYTSGATAASGAQGTSATLQYLGNGEWTAVGVWSASGDNVFRNTGNVGIGTNNPQSSLHVVGQIIASGPINSGSEVRPTGIGMPLSFGADGTYVGTAGNYIAFAHSGVSEDFIGYKNNTFYMKDSPGGADVLDPNLVVGGDVSGKSFITTSDRNAKENFNTISPADVLAKVLGLPISEWNFKTDARTTHIGPMAQDFYAAFGVGPDDTHIATVDADGVALAAIQGLNQKLEHRLEQKETEITELKARLEEIERLLNHKLNGGAQ